MTEKEFQQIHRLDDEDFQKIKYICKLFKGTVAAVKEIKKGATNVSN